MAKKENRLFGFQNFMDGILGHRDKIMKLRSFSLRSLNSMDCDRAFDVIGHLWELARDISGSLSNRESTLVLGTKTLHHILPDLVPPIDIANTLGFFKISGTEEKKFGYVFIKYLDIYKSKYDVIEKLTRTNTWNSKHNQDN